MFSRRLDHVSLKLIPFEQAVLRFLQRHSLTDRPVLVAVSGGVDSMALLFCLWRLRHAARIQVKAAYIHHGQKPGKGRRSRQDQYRDQALRLVEKFCASHDIEFLSNVNVPEIGWAPRALRSEKELRDFRQLALQALAERTRGEGEPVPIFFAHHQDDLVETQLLRFLRGTGLQGLKGFAAFENHRARPLIEFRKKEIAAYAKRMRVRFVADPSNRSDGPLRNWLRQKWLRPLERREAGLYGSLARSLGLLSSVHSGLSKEQQNSVIRNGRIEQAAFMALTREEKEAILALYMRQQNIQDYRASHIREICRRLTARKTEHNFRLLRRQWHINAQHIFCEPSPRRDTLNKLTTEE